MLNSRLSSVQSTIGDRRTEMDEAKGERDETLARMKSKFSELSKFSPIAVKLDIRAYRHR